MSDESSLDQTLENSKKIAHEHIKSVSEAVSKTYTSGLESIHAAINLGVALLEARQALGANFYEIIDSKIIHKKKMQRYIKMVTHKDCDDQLAKKPHLNDKKDLKIDTRVVALLENGFSQWSIPSIGKITDMRYLSDEDFVTVLGGEYEPLEKSIKERKKLTPTGKIKAELEEKFKGIMEDEKDAIELVNDYSKTALLTKQPPSKDGGFE
jgi:hypothetical protein